MSTPLPIPFDFSFALGNNSDWSHLVGMYIQLIDPKSGVYSDSAGIRRIVKIDWDPMKMRLDIITQWPEGVNLSGRIIWITQLIHCNINGILTEDMYIASIMKMDIDARHPMWRIAHILEYTESLSPEELKQRLVLSQWARNFAVHNRGRVLSFIRDDSTGIIDELFIHINGEIIDVTGSKTPDDLEKRFHEFDNGVAWRGARHHISELMYLMASEIATLLDIEQIELVRKLKGDPDGQ